MSPIPLRSDGFHPTGDLPLLSGLPLLRRVVACCDSATKPVMDIDDQISFSYKEDTHMPY
jgi:hypothetical protein